MVLGRVFGKIFKSTDVKNKSKRAKEIPEVAETYHKMSLDELVRALQTSATDGLDETTVKELLKTNGKNKIKQTRQNPTVKICGYFFSGFGCLFLFAAVACILAWKPIGQINGTPDPVNLALGILLLFVILLQSAFNAFQDWSSQKVMKSIRNMMPSTAYVIRNGREMLVPVEEIVVGDLVKLAYGNKVPADCRIIETNDLKFDKSMLTGESESVEATIEPTSQRYVESKNIAFMTTLITNGQGKGLVVATGNNSIMGKIARLTDKTCGNKRTSLQREIQRFINIIVTGAIIAAVVVVVTWAAWLRVKYPNYINLTSLIVNTISVVIGFIPDGLPVSVTLSLLIIALRMKKNNVLVKNLTVIETLSCVNVIASDKTGTLTQNKMFVASAALGNQIIDLNSARKPDFERTIGFNQLVTSCGLCNNASFDDEETLQFPISARKGKGDATDIAMLKFSAEHEHFANITEKYSILAEIPFNSRNKWMAKLVRPNNPLIHRAIFGPDDEFNNEMVLLKGAPDYLLKKSTHIIRPDGSITRIKPSITSGLIQIQNDWCILGQRVLLICRKKCQFNSSNSVDLENFINVSNDFCVIGLIGIIDPPREGIADVISKCKQAGIRVLMLTGDYSLTAAAIALQTGILTQVQYDTAETMRIKHKHYKDTSEKSSLLLTGADLDNMSPDDWRIVTCYQEIVLARTTPEQKLKTVKEFQRDGFIVGVTGDGVNDAPALKSADIGIAMGSGSEVAMEASQLVLLDNNFASILIAIENGRLVFDNLKKVILFLLPGGSMGELIPVLMSIFLGVRLNLSSFAMLVIALFTDIPPSLSMMKEPPETDLLKQAPRTNRDHLTDRNFLLQAYGFMGLMVVFFSQFIYFIYMKTHLHLNPNEIFLAFDKLESNFNASNFNYLKVKYPNMTSDQLRHEFDEQYYTAQTVTFVSIVVLQIFGNLLATRTHVKSFFQQPPWQKKLGNMWIFVAQITSIVLLLIAVYVPIFHRLFNTRPIPVEFLFMPLIFCVFIFFIDELRKLCVRRKVLDLHKIAW